MALEDIGSSNGGDQDGLRIDGGLEGLEFGIGK